MLKKHKGKICFIIVLLTAISASLIIFLPTLSKKDGKVPAVQGDKDVKITEENSTKLTICADDNIVGNKKLLTKLAEEFNKKRYKLKNKYVTVTVSPKSAYEYIKEGSNCDIVCACMRNLLPKNEWSELKYQGEYTDVLSDSVVLLQNKEKTKKNNLIKTDSTSSNSGLMTTLVMLSQAGENNEELCKIYNNASDILTYVTEEEVIEKIKEENPKYAIISRSNFESDKELKEHYTSKKIGPSMDYPFMMKKDISEEKKEEAWLFFTYCKSYGHKYALDFNHYKESEFKEKVQFSEKQIKNIM